MRQERRSWLVILAVGIFAAMGCGEQQPADDGDVETATATQALTSVKVPQALAAGAYHSLFLRKDGTVWAWGQNVAGQLGTGSTSSTPIPQPTQVNALPAIKALAAGIAHSLALDVSGNVWAWGQNASGQAGLGSAGGTVPVPARVTALSGIQAIAANGNFSLALGTDGRLWAWGQNASGQAGTGATSAAVATPTVVQGLPTLRAMAAGVNHTLALDADGKVWSWGQNTFGQVGTGSANATVLTPVQIAGVPRARAVAAGAGHSLIVDEQFGNVWAWGQNTFGQVGTGSASSTPVLAPTPVSGVFAVTALVAGHNSSLAIIGNGYAVAWGHNAAGQLGNGTTVNSASPVSVTGLADAKALAAGAQHALALRPGCPMWAWGNNGQGQLGTGVTSAVPVMAPAQALLVNTFYFDGDMDGFGDEYLTEQACEPSPGYVEEVDCDDYTADTYPGAPESCNGMDDNCDGAVDDGNPSGGENCSTGQPGVCAAGMTACTNGSVECQQRQAASAEQCDGLDNDCDGAADDGNPGGLQACATGQQGACGEGVTYCTHGALECAPTRGASSEVCDGADNDCDGQVDNGLAFQAWYRDQDGDNYGLTEQSVQACSRPSGYAPNPGDCNDTSVVFHPGAVEACDGVDNDCDAQADEGVPTQAWYRDADGDGFGSVSNTVQNCRQPAGFVSDASDCDDSSAAIKPGGTEVCDALDNDCDAQVDEGVLSAWYRDADGDGFGDAAQPTQACGRPTGYVASASDCNDTSAAIRPGATEVCDGVDNNCSGAVDEGLALLTWYRDSDGDTYGTSTNTLQKCSQPSGYVSNASDCNDSNTAIKPGATEVCDGVDNNCNGSSDEGLAISTWYHDADGDGFGTSTLTQQKCSQPSGYASNASDCNDSDAGIRPGALEVFDGKDNNCNGVTDDLAHTRPPLGTGGRHTVALRQNGTVWAWGYNGHGQLGDGTSIPRNPPVQVQGLTGGAAVAAGYNHTVALRQDGTAWAWGNNSYGQLGDGTTIGRLTPVLCLTGVAAIAAGLEHTVALRTDGTVWAWGRNNYGQLGDGTTIDRLTPVQVQGLTGVAAVAAGPEHTVALRTDGTVWAWGRNNYGQLGDGTTTEDGTNLIQLTPVQAQGLTGVAAIAAGSNHTVALRTDGTVWTWGDNTWGALGDGTFTRRRAPVKTLLTGVAAIAAGAIHTVALKTDGSVWAWGDNHFRQLGGGTTANIINRPVQVPGLTGVAALAAGGGTTVALRMAGTVWAWGDYGCEPDEDGTYPSYPLCAGPVQVQGLGN
jgi:alpha-tubulin suppressor-like RCC1 family protein